MRTASDQGFDVAVCKAVAAAVLGDATKVKLCARPPAKPASPRSPRARSTCWSRNSTWTFSRDTDLKFDFVGVNYYDGQGFMVKKDLGVSSAKELDGATVCIQTGTTTELNLADFFKANNITYTPVTVADDSRGAAPVSGRCLRRLHDRRLGSGCHPRDACRCRKPHHPARDHLERAARPAGPSRRQQLGRHRPLDLLRTGRGRRTWHHLGQRRTKSAASTTNPEVKRLLGTEGDMGAMMGLDAEWAKRAIAASGNYGEIFAAQHRRSRPRSVWPAA